MKTDRAEKSWRGVVLETQIYKSTRRQPALISEIVKIFENSCSEGVRSFLETKRWNKEEIDQAIIFIPLWQKDKKLFKKEKSLNLRIFLWQVAGWMVFPILGFIVMLRWPNIHAEKNFLDWVNLIIDIVGLCTIFYGCNRAAEYYREVLNREV